MPRGRTLSLRGLSFGSTKRNISQGPPSPTFSDATNASAINFGANIGPSKIITRANLKASMQAYEDLVNSCATYRAALITMSNATAAFADAMERCSSLKGPSYEAGSRLQAASGVHHLIGNLWHVLSDTLDNTFEKPMRQHLHEYKTIVNERSQKYERTLREKSQAIHETENRSMNKKERNLENFRQALAILQRQVDELDELKVSHYQEIVDHEEGVWEAVQSKICVVVRSEMDMFDRITSKASDPIIEPMLQSVPDPFDSYGPPPSENQIFSILAPLSMTTPSPSTAAVASLTSPLVSTLPECDPTDSAPMSATTKIASWLPDAQMAEWTSAPSPSPAPPRSLSPPTSRPSSPPNGTGSRRHSLPLVQQHKQESNLRSMLSVIDETKPETGPSSGRAALPDPMTNLSASRPSSDADVNGSVAYEEMAAASTEIDYDGGQLTPKFSALFSLPELSQGESESAQEQDSRPLRPSDGQSLPKLSVST